MPYQSIDAAIAQAEQLVRQFTVLFHLADTDEISELSAIRDSAGKGLLMAERHAEALRNQKREEKRFMEKRPD